VELTSSGTVNIALGESLRLNANLLPATARSELKWTTSSKKIAAVDAEGIVTPVSEGTATITVTTRNSKKDTVKVKVFDPKKPTSVTLEESGTVYAWLGESLQLHAEVGPETAETKLSWTSSNTRYATVDANGVVTPVKEGTVTITVKTANGLKDTVKVQAADPKKPVSVTLEESGTVYAWLGESLKLHAAVAPETAETKLSWTSSSTRYATVDANGVVTPVKEGTATITVKTANGKKDTVKVQVADPKKPVSVTLAESGTVDAWVGVPLQLHAEVAPETAETKLSWTSSSTRYATVDASGVVTPVKTGTVTITVKTANGKKDSVKLKIAQPKEPVGLSLKPDGELILAEGEKLQLTAQLQPASAYGEIRWSSSNENCVAVDENGLLTGVSEGMAAVTAATGNGISAECIVEVRKYYGTSPVSDFEYSLEGGKCAIVGYTGSDSEIHIPAEINGFTVTSIGGYAFEKSRGVIVIPETITDISTYMLGGSGQARYIYVAPANPAYASVDGVLYSKDLSKLICYPRGSAAAIFAVPAGVREISDNAFSNCSKLSQIMLPEGLEIISSQAFRDCEGLTDIVLPASLVRIEDAAFRSCEELRSMHVPGGVASIGDEAFAFCYKLGNVTLSEGLESIGEAAFWDCTGLTSLDIPDSVTSIGSRIFYQCTFLRSIRLPKGLSTIPASAFYECYNLRNVVFPEALVSVEGSAFGFCTSLERVDLPDTVTKLGGRVFGNCENLQHLTIPAGVAQIQPDLLSYANRSVIIYGKAGSAAEAFAAENRYPFVIV